MDFDRAYTYEKYYRGDIFMNSSFRVCLLIAIIGGIVIYLTFLSKKNEGKFTGFAGWLYNFLNFKKLVIDVILKILYIIIALFLTFSGLVMLTQSLRIGLTMLILGNIITRMIYEFLLILVLICKNTSDINKKIKSNTPDEQELFVTQLDTFKKNNVIVKEQTGYLCGSCGKSLKSTDEYCPNCGKKTK